MTELETRIREEIGKFCDDTCAEYSKKALLAVLKLHSSDDDGHRCIKEIFGYSVHAWYDEGEDCPTVVAIGRGLGVLDDEPVEQARALRAVPNAE